MKQDKKFIILISIFIIVIILATVFISSKVFIKKTNDKIEAIYSVEYTHDYLLTDDDMTDICKTIDNRLSAYDIKAKIYFKDENIHIFLNKTDNIENILSIITATGDITFRTTSGDLLMDSSVLNNKKASVGYSTESGNYISLSVKDYDEFYKQTKKVSEMEDNQIVIWLDYVPGTMLEYVNSNEKTGYGYYTTDIIGKKEVKTFHICGDLANSNCLSVARVPQGFASDVIIQGNFTMNEAKKLVNLINSGTLSVKLTRIK